MIPLWAALAIKETAVFMASRLCSVFPSAAAKPTAFLAAVFMVALYDLFAALFRKLCL